LSRHELREIGRLYRVRQRASQHAGATTGDFVFAQRIEEQTKVVRKQADDVHDVKQEIKEANKKLAAIQKAAQHDMPKKISDAVNKPATTAARRRRHG
jgi:cell division protein FtsB